MERKLQMKLKLDVRLLFVMSELPNRLTTLDFISSISLYKEINEQFLAQQRPADDLCSPGSVHFVLTPNSKYSPLGNMASIK